MMQSIENFLEYLGQVVSLPVFAFVGSVIEETFAPIPSPLILGAVGTLAYSQDYPLYVLPLLAVIASTGKVLGAVVIYYLSDKLENIATPFLSKFFAFNHKEVESIGERLGSNWKNYTTLIFLRAVPFLPSFVISVACGVIKMDMKVFILGTYVGSIVRGLVFIVLGYGGYAFVDDLVNGFSLTEKIVEIVVALIVLVLLATLYKKRSSFMGTK